MSNRGIRLWRWLVRAYCVACIAEVTAILAYHAANPKSEGIPCWLFVFVNLPALGIELLPLILVVEIVLAAKGVYRTWAFIVQVILLVAAWGFCVQGLRQTPAPPPKSGITRGATQPQREAPGTGREQSATHEFHLKLTATHQLGPGCAALALGIFVRITRELLEGEVDAMDSAILLAVTKKQTPGLRLQPEATASLEK